MIEIKSSYLNMSEKKHNLFKQILVSFYKSALYSNEKYESFNSKLKEITNNNKEESLEKLSNYITDYIYETDGKNYKGLFVKNNIKKYSKIIASLLKNKPDILEILKEGGKNNFVDYIELSIAEFLTKDSSLKVIFQFEKQETLKAIREMQYYRNNPPDQLLR